MDDGEWGWPFWKFGLKEEDLYTKLHDQYNTVPSSIQDPEAFHHDVCELSYRATNIDDLHRLLADRKQQRLRELNNALEAASVALSADAALIGAEQWEHAAQLFRTRSLDSLVRFFASYLAAPSDTCSSSGQSLASARNSCAFSCPDDSAPSMTDEPLEFYDDFADFNDVRPPQFACAPDSSHLPPSPCSMPPCPLSLSSAVCRDGDDTCAHKLVDGSDDARDYFSRHVYTPSVTNSESEPFLLLDSRLGLRSGDDESESSVPGTPCTTASNVSDSAYDELAKAVILPLDKGEGHSSEGREDGSREAGSREAGSREDGDDKPPRDRIVVESGLVDSPTPEAERRNTGLFCSQTLSRSQRQRARSPSPAGDGALIPARVCGDPRGQTHSLARRWRPRFAPRATARGGQGSSEWPVSRIQKPTSTAVRSRPGGRRRPEFAHLPSGW